MRVSNQREGNADVLPYILKLEQREMWPIFGRNVASLMLLSFLRVIIAKMFAKSFLLEEWVKNSIFCVFTKSLSKISLLDFKRHHFFLLWNLRKTFFVTVWLLNHKKFFFIYKGLLQLVHTNIYLKNYHD